MEISSVNPTSLAAASAAVREPSSDWLAQQRELIQAVKAINASEMFENQGELTFVLDRKTKQTVMRIVDRQTGEVIRQLPPESVLNMAAELKKRR
jgi:flagellar protein FlaG